jgi:aryl-alcohol dehydrogenase-like predicted oxidoreductase
MRYRTFGHSGLRVSELFLGTMTFGDDWGWGAPVEECRKLFTTYAEAGGNVIDTANKYTEGSSERIVGELIASERDRFVVCTKYTLSDDENDPNASGNHRKNLIRSVAASLRRLATDRIDLLWAHIWDPATPLEEMMRALDDLVRAGKVLYVGMSDTPAWVVSRANMLADWRGWTPFVGVQMPYSLVQRDGDRELLPMAGQLGVSVAAWSPLGRGLLSGKYSRSTRSAEPGSGRVDRAQLSPREVAIAREVDGVADELGLSSSQVALAWVMARSPRPHPIVGARTLEQLTNNLAAAAVSLPDEAMARLTEVSAIDRGFPADFIDEMRGFVYGRVGSRIELPTYGSGS